MTEHNNRSSSVVSMRDITPEVAAQVVKNYLLPMFDSDNKKYLKKRSKSKAGERQDNNNDDIIEQPKTIYDELKLSDKLISQIDKLKYELNTVKQQLSNSNLTIEDLKQKVKFETFQSWLSDANNNKLIKCFNHIKFKTYHYF